MVNESINLSNVVKRVNIAMELYWLNKLKKNNKVSDAEYFELKTRILKKLKS